MASDWGCRDLTSTSGPVAPSGQPGHVSGRRPEEGARFAVWFESSIRYTDGCDLWVTWLEAACLQGWRLLIEESRRILAESWPGCTCLALPFARHAHIGHVRGAVSG